MSKNIREILKNKMVISGLAVTTAATIAIGMSSTKKASINHKIENKIAQVEEFKQDNIEEKKEETKEIENKLEAKVLESESNDIKKDLEFQNQVNGNQNNVDKKVVRQPIAKNVSKASKKIKTIAIKVVDTKKNQDLVNKRDDLNKKIEELKNQEKEAINVDNQDKKVEIKPISKEVIDNKLEYLKEDTISKEVIDSAKEEKENHEKEVEIRRERVRQALEAIKKANDKILAERVKIKANALKYLDAIKDITPKSIEEMAKVSNNVINAMESAKAYNNMVLADKEATQEMKKEAKDILERANKELKNIMVLAEAVSAKSKDLTWTEYVTNLYNYSTGQITKAYNYVIDETSKAYNDVLNSGTNIYNVSKNAYDTAKYTYENFDNVKEASKDLSSVSNIVGVFSKESEEVLKSIRPFVKEYKPTDSYGTIAKEKVEAITNFVKNNLKNNAKAVNNNKKGTSLISPITNIVDNATGFANSKVNKLKNTVDMSNTYVTTKNTAKNAVKALWGLFIG